MAINSARNIQTQHESLFGGNLQQGDNLDQALAIVDQLLTILFKGQSLECLDLTKFGIVCEPEEKSTILCTILNNLLASQESLNTKFAGVLKALQNQTQTTTTVSDEKVKATATSAQAKYLVDTIKGSAGKVIYDQASDTIVIKGLVPLGARMFINPNRLPDLDGDGKGKPNTDLVGWQVRNGKNGTDNALEGRFVRYASLLAAAKKGGSNSIKLETANIPSLTIALTGSIDEALTSPIIVEVPYGSLEKRFGVGDKRPVVVPDNMVSGYKNSKPLDVRHTHSHNLAASFQNNNNTALTIEPEYITEIPIEFIGY